MADAVELRPAPVGHDIANEAYRLYTYADGKTFKIVDPVTLYIMENGSHRVVCSKGLTHRPTPGYVGISWKPIAGAPAFDF